jgi:hypothetical protein
MHRFYGQGKHLIALLILLIPVIWYSRLTGVLEGEWLGLSARAWYWIAVGLPVLHQFGSMLLWRVELHGKIMTRAFGDRAFMVFMGFFFPGLTSRPISVLALALADKGTVDIAAWILDVIALIMLPALLYLFYSIVRYFGIQRAAGADHFLEEYTTKPMVVEGIFRYIPNAMYVIGFFTVWIPALLLASQAALLVSGFQHALIWAHYFYTEAPDMQVIYGEGKAGYTRRGIDGSRRVT